MESGGLNPSVSQSVNVLPVFLLMVRVDVIKSESLRVTSLFPQ